MKKIIKKIINIFGYKLISNKPSSSELLTMDMALKRLSKRNIEVKTVIDVGASNGIWTEQCIKYFPKAAFFLIEAQIEHKPALIEMQKKNKF